MDDVIAAVPLGPRVTSVEPIDDYLLRLIFTNGEKRVFDAKPLFSCSVFNQLRNKTFFEAVKVSHGSILWPNDIDYCPDTLYAESVPDDLNVETDLTDEPPTVPVGAFSSGRNP